MRSELPTGTVTFVFTDVEGSTKLLHELGDVAYAEELSRHRQIVRGAFAAEGGIEVDTQGDAFFFAFPTAPGALRAAAAALDQLAEGPIRIRVGVHTGTPHVTDEGYVGGDVHRAARIGAAGQGGQILVSAAAAALAGTGALRDLGEHRLKDLSAPEHVFQLGDGEFPPLKSLHQTNLPVPATPFLGREREVQELAALLAGDNARIVTLTGPGGTGKTRLALQAAGAAADAFPGGVWWVPLASLRDARLVLEAAATALGATVDLADHIGSKRLLLLFDNFEHVIAASTGIGGLVERCPELTVVATSREPLRLDGEWEYGVDPLREAEAVALFASRARAARRDFNANGEVRDICARLDNLPLAIELAAARVKVLSPQALLERLERRLPVLSGGARDAPERQRTLRATIEWSHDLLTDEEQSAFRRFAVFAGGATLEAFEEVCETDLDVIGSLVDKSLLRQSDDRFWMLETIREFAAERLAAAGETDAFARRHAAFFLRLAEQSEAHLRAETPHAGGEWFDRLERDRANLRAAFETFDAAGDDDALVRLVSGSGRYWHNASRLTEARVLIDRALHVEHVEPRVRANLLVVAGDAATNTGDLAKARMQAEEAIALFRETGDGWGVAEASWLLGYALAEAGEYAEGSPHIAEAVRLFDETGDEHSALWAMRSLAFTYHGLDDLDRARAVHEESLERARALGNRPLEAVVLGALAMVALDDGRIDDSLALLEENTRILLEAGDELMRSVNLGRVACVLTFASAPTDAARLLACMDRQLEELGAHPPWVVRMADETRARLAEQLDDEGLRRERDRGAALALEEALEDAFNCVRRARGAR
jgi:predicted ATPase/class 3 adenylate cyclase